MAASPFVQHFQKAPTSKGMAGACHRGHWWWLQGNHCMWNAWSTNFYSRPEIVLVLSHFWENRQFVRLIGNKIREAAGKPQSPQDATQATRTCFEPRFSSAPSSNQTSLCSLVFLKASFFLMVGGTLWVGKVASTPGAFLSQEGSNPGPQPWGFALLPGGVQDFVHMCDESGAREDRTSFSSVPRVVESGIFSDLKKLLIWQRRQTQLTLKGQIEYWRRVQREAEKNKVGWWCWKNLCHIQVSLGF